MSPMPTIMGNFESKISSKKVGAAVGHCVFSEGSEQKLLPLSEASCGDGSGIDLAITIIVEMCYRRPGSCQRRLITPRVLST